MTAPELPTLVTAAAYAGRLKLAVPTDPVVLQSWTDALLDASGTLRDVIRQPLTPATTTLPVPWNASGYFLIPLNPVTSVLSVSNAAGVVDPSLYTVQGQRLYVDPSVIDCDGLGEPQLTVTVQHGWDPIPREIQRWVCVLAAAQLAAVARGNLGNNGGVTSVAVDDGKVTYEKAADQIPAAVRDRLRATYGGEA